METAAIPSIKKRYQRYKDGDMHTIYIGEFINVLERQIGFFVLVILSNFIHLNLLRIQIMQGKVSPNYFDICSGHSPLILCLSWHSP